MAKQEEQKQPAKLDVSQPESLRALDQETLIGLIVRLYDQNRQLSELLQSFLQEKYNSKNERFIDSNQLRLFGSDEEVPSQNSNSGSN